MSASSILTASGRHLLVPLGIRQRGRSRVWLDDQKWWLGVIEFQPSSWSKGTYLNTGVNWLWNDRDHIVFDLAERWGGHVSYESDEQFEPEAQRLVQKAADALLGYRDKIASPEMAATQLLVQSSIANSLAAGMAFALSGNPETARQHLGAFLEGDGDPRDWAVAKRGEVRELLNVSDEELQGRVHERVVRGRRALKLAP